MRNTKTMSNKRQTAVEWLVEQLPPIQQEGLGDIIDLAKEMERQQIIDAFDGHPLIARNSQNGEEYYTETYNTPQP